MRIVEPGEVAELIRRLAEARHELAGLQRQVEQHDSPLSYLIQLRLEGVSTNLDKAFTALVKGAKLITQDEDQPTS